MAKTYYKLDRGPEIPEQTGNIVALQASSPWPFLMSAHRMLRLEWDPNPVGPYAIAKRHFLAGKFRLAHGYSDPPPACSFSRSEGCVARGVVANRARTCQGLGRRFDQLLQRRGRPCGRRKTPWLWPAGSVTG